MTDGRRAAPPFDVALALRRIGSGFWLDFAPIVVLGFGMVTVPQVALALAGSNAGSTVIATFAGLLRVLFVVIVSHGALARIAGRPLPAARFAAAGLAASPRALSVALLLGVGVVVVLVALLLAALAGSAAPLVRAGTVGVAFAAAVVTVAAVPLALTRRVMPWQAIVTAAALARGRRSGIAAVLALVALAIVPARFVVAATVYGPGASLARIAAINATMGVTSPGLWLLALFDLLAWSLAAGVPAAVFAGLGE